MPPIEFLPKAPLLDPNAQGLLSLGERLLGRIGDLLGAGVQLAWYHGFLWGIVIATLVCLIIGWIVLAKKK